MNKKIFNYKWGLMDRVKTLKGLLANLKKKKSFKFLGLEP